MVHNLCISNRVDLTLQLCFRLKQKTRESKVKISNISHLRVHLHLIFPILCFLFFLFSYMYFLHIFSSFSVLYSHRQFQKIVELENHGWHPWHDSSTVGTRGCDQFVCCCECVCVCVCVCVSLRAIFLNQTFVPTHPTHHKRVFLNATSGTIIPTKILQIVERFVGPITPCHKFFVVYISCLYCMFTLFWRSLNIHNVCATLLEEYKSEFSEIDQCIFIKIS